jgi:hypothetical protein
MPSGRQSKRRRREGRTSLPPAVQGKRGAVPAARPKHPTVAGGGRNRWWIGGGAAFIATVFVLAIALTHGSVKPAGIDFAQMSGLQNGSPPWDNGDGELQSRLAQVHLDPLAQETLAFHIHQHLDVYVNGGHVTVPALIGIYDSSFITELHTHKPDGVIHVESAKHRPYTLGQFFGEWGVRLNATCLGRYCGDLHWWVNSKPQTGNAADFVLHPHQEIVIAAGKPPPHIPASYSFPAGE